MIILRITKIINRDDKGNEIAQKCEACGNSLFYLSQGTKRRNLHFTVTSKVWDQKQYYIKKCTGCNLRIDQLIYDWRTVYMNKF